MKLTEKEKVILQKMGNYFYEEKAQSLGDNATKTLIYEETKKLLYDLKIQQIILAGSNLVVVTSRPGLLIGLRGKRITQLKEYLGLNIEIREYEGPELETFMLSGILIPQPISPERL